MELEDHQTLVKFQERLIRKIQSFSTWAEFISWAKGMTASKFKAIVVDAIDEIVSDNDMEKQDLLEIKTLLQG